MDNRQAIVERVMEGMYDVKQAILSEYGENEEMLNLAITCYLVGVSACSGKDEQLLDDIDTAMAFDILNNS